MADGGGGRRSFISSILEKTAFPAEIAFSYISFDMKDMGDSQAVPGWMASNKRRAEKTSLKRKCFVKKPLTSERQSLDKLSISQIYEVLHKRVVELKLQTYVQQ